MEERRWDRHALKDPLHGEFAMDFGACVSRFESVPVLTEQSQQAGNA